MPDVRRQLLGFYQAALAAVDGHRRTRDFLYAYPPEGDCDLIAMGKAACAMAAGAHEVLAGRILRAFVVAPHGAAETLPWPVIETSHPLPDATSLAAGQALEDFVRDPACAKKVIVLLSGGASALVESLREGVTLDDLDLLNRWLLSHRADIVTMNRLRTRLSRIKGGGLASWLAGARVTCLAISDVPGDDPRVIGSGPLSPSPVTQDVFPRAFPEALCALYARLAPAPRGQTQPESLRYETIATLDDAMTAALAAAQRAGLPARRCGRIAGDAEAAGRTVVQALRTADAGEFLLWGGETVVGLPEHPGRGGRCQQLALAAALAIRPGERMSLLAAATDGADGVTTDAGALIDEGTCARGQEAGLDPARALERADAGTLLEAAGDLVTTGPTGTNVTDLVIGIRSER